MEVKLMDCLNITGHSVAKRAEENDPLYMHNAAVSTVSSGVTRFVSAN